MTAISYNAAQVAGETLAKATTTSEVTVLEVTDMTTLKKSQFSAFWDISLGDHTSMKLRYYFSTGKQSGANYVYYQVPAKNVSTGVLGDIPSVADSTSPTQSSHLMFVEDFGISGAVAFKVTATGVGGAAGTVNTLTVMVRDN